MEQHTQVMDPEVDDPVVTDALVEDARLADATIPAQPVRDLGSARTESFMTDSATTSRVTDEGEAVTEPDGADRAGMDLLAAHVPLTLLLDLAGNDRPESREILLDERPSADELAWIGEA